MVLPAISLAIVGAQYPNKRGPTRRFELALCKPGEPIELRREPNNPADPRAVAVYSARGVQLGYLTAERAPWIGAMINRGREIRAIFQRQTDYGGVIRVAFDGAVPELPTDSRHEQRDEEPDFWPDEEWRDT